MLSDNHSRKIDYLRLSVTDLCNLRCRYCMPPEGAVKQKREKILSFEEIQRLVALFVQLGIRSVRITGGEPLVRKDLPQLIAMLHAIPGLEDILLTTNGFRLKELAPALKEAGLTRINIHLDTLSPETYRQITCGGDISEVLDGIEAARRADLAPIKINTVLMKDYNQGEVTDLVRFAAERDLVLRFIELMPIGTGHTMNQHFLEAEAVYQELSKQWTLIPYGQRLGRGPAEYYKIVELGCVIGLIQAVSKPFCNKCNRIRIAADGQLQDCLAYDGMTELRSLLRTDTLSDDAIIEEIQKMIGLKREGHGDFELPQFNKTCGMYGIGG